MLCAMPEKQTKPKSAKKTVSKKTAEKGHSKTKNSRSSAAKKTVRRSASRKKRTKGNIIAALGILCVLLLSFNLVLVLKLIPALKTSGLTGKQPHTAAEKELPAAPETPETAALLHQAGQRRDTQNAVTKEFPQKHTDTESLEHRAEKPAPQKTENIKREKDPPEKRTVAAAPTAAQQKASAAETVPHTKKPAVRQAPLKNTPKKNLMPDTQTAIRPVAVPEKPKKQIPHAGTLIFVFDDAGHNLNQLEYFLRLPFPCTIAVLPGLRYSSESARRIRKAGKQVILHQPMQSVDRHIDPGPGAVTPGLSAEQIKAVVRKNLEEIWPVAGMNNHEGSLITADEAAMKAILEVVAEKRIFFLDSRTTAKSVAAKVAKEQNMTVWERAIFIDNDKNRRAMEAEIKKGLNIAKRKGSAIMIGHVFTIELAELLTEMYPEFIEEGFSLSTIGK